MRDHADHMPDADDAPLHDMEGTIGDLDLSTLMGDIRDEMLTRIKHLKTTWPLMSQGEQAEVANGLELFAKKIIRDAVGTLTEHRFPKAVVKLEEIKIAGKQIIGKITTDNIAVNRDVLGENVTSYCQIVMVDSEVFFGERAPAKIDPDQPGLDLDGDGEGDPVEDDERLALPKPDDQRPDEGDLE